jgi:cytidylate kinase
MSELSPSLIVERVAFTAGEHLEVEQQIERRARELWCLQGCQDGSALDDWLQAEREVSEHFIWAYARRRALRQAPRRGASIRVAQKKPEAPILKRGRTIAARDQQSASALR